MDTRTMRRFSFTAPVRTLYPASMSTALTGVMPEKTVRRSSKRLLLYLNFVCKIQRVSKEVTPVLSAAFVAAQYGNGTYFAVNATYSAQDLYSKPNQNGEKHMYLCRVLTGDHTLGQKGMLTPPPKTSNSVELYDSVVDNNAKPHIFVVFHDNQAYPEYLIKFK